ncbi:nitroreductase family protein [Enterocloster alcoholdehydrogenati]|uniref:nitroreductase family protein n=1 Tax=Enterocloster alcoholdehydrogenati TaxID=2547410 RepID=UPI001A9AB9DD|nr:nitroreductase family protein [Enterocloster alcoholdehydrogenati]
MYRNFLILSLLAPTAMNQQKFTFILEENTVSLKAGIGFYTKVDLGIVKYHFEIGAGENNFHWTPSRHS